MSEKIIWRREPSQRAEGARIRFIETGMGQWGIKIDAGVEDDSDDGVRWSEDSSGLLTPADFMEASYNAVEFFSKRTFLIPSHLGELPDSQLEEMYLSFSRLLQAQISVGSDWTATLYVEGSDFNGDPLLEIDVDRPL